MKKLGIVLVLSAFILAGCNTVGTQQVISPQLTVVMPPASYFVCPDVSKWPDPNTLTDSQVAQLLNTLNKNNHICKNNMGAIYTYLSKAKKTIH